MRVNGYTSASQCMSNMRAGNEWPVKQFARLSAGWLELCHSVSVGEGTERHCVQVSRGDGCRCVVCTGVCVCGWGVHSRLQSQSARGRRRQGLRAAWPSLTLCRARQRGRAVLSLQGSTRLQTQHSQSPPGPQPPRAWLCSCGSRGQAWFTCARVCLSWSAKGARRASEDSSGEMCLAVRARVGVWVSERLPLCVRQATFGKAASQANRACEWRHSESCDCSCHQSARDLCFP